MVSELQLIVYVYCYNEKRLLTTLIAIGRFAQSPIIRQPTILVKAVATTICPIKVSS